MYIYIYICKVCTGHIAHPHLTSLSSTFDFLSKVTRTSIISPVHLVPAPCGLAFNSRACWCVWLWSDGQVVRWSGGQLWPPNMSAATRGDGRQPVDLEAALASLASALTHSLVLHWNHADWKHPKPRASRLFTCPVSCWLHTNMEDWYIPVEDIISIIHLIHKSTHRVGVLETMTLLLLQASADPSGLSQSLPQQPLFPSVVRLWKQM